MTTKIAVWVQGEPAARHVELLPDADLEACLAGEAPETLEWYVDDEVAASAPHEIIGRFRFAGETVYAVRRV